ncbi:MAG TPA: 2-oxoglutarate and iron-dependent oxygenase domain-containing protein, partial [Acidimicrobiales bacterium]|nr:2-oxoglutarate and iron-dependent oxygenase domain-containing protein [Acidimicrobiales bacterium]
MATVPAIDLGSAQAASHLDRACREVGFFTVAGHGVPAALLDRLDAAARAVFAQPDDVKASYAMARAGKAWRGWVPVGGELTSGVPDRKEGLYFGSEDDPDDPRPLHGANLFPPGLREPVLAWMAAMTDLGQQVLDLLGGALGLGTGWFRTHLTGDPVTLFRIFHYPPQAGGSDGWGVAEHTDYGLLTLLAQDGTSGLQVRAADGAWLDVPPDRDVLVCNLGDMLEKLTGGRYRSTPHRVRNEAGRGRLSFPFFLDPSWDAVCRPLPLAGAPPADDAGRRWDGTSVRAWDGVYGDYLTAKVAKVFPLLG